MSNHNCGSTLRSTPAPFNSDPSDLYGYNYLDKKALYKDIVPLFNDLFEDELCLIRRYYEFGEKQKDIAKSLNITQGAVSHRLFKINKKLIFLRDMPKINRDLKDILSSYFEDFDIDLINTMIETTCQSETAKILNKKYSLEESEKMNQIKVRSKYEKFLNKMRDIKHCDKDLEDCYKLMEYIKNNLYMKHQIKNVKKIIKLNQELRHD